MPWVRIDDGFARHPKVAAAGPLAMAMQIAALCYCNRELTDGFVPRSVARTLLDFEVEDSEGRLWRLTRRSGHIGENVDAEWVINFMVECGMWSDVPGGFFIHDYTEYQPTKADVLREREKGAKRQSEWRDRKRNAVTDPVTHSGSDDGADGVTNDPVTGAPYPVPVPKEEKPPVGPPEGDTPKQKRKSRIPEDWEPNDTCHKVAKELCMSDQQFHAEMVKFKTHFEAKGELMLDWQKAAQNWLRRSQEFAPRNQVRTPPRPVYAVDTQAY